MLVDVLDGLDSAPFFFSSFYPRIETGSPHTTFRTTSEGGAERWEWDGMTPLLGMSGEDIVDTDRTGNQHGSMSIRYILCFD